jgi:hypothetical protein
MIKRVSILTLGFAVLAALCCSHPSVAKLTANGTSLNGFASNASTLHAVRLVLPDGTELKFH